jgi:hypothetical protein
MVDLLGRNGRTFSIMPRLGLLRQPQPRQRDIEHDGFVFGRRFILSLANAIRGVLPIPRYADHHCPHYTCTRPESPRLSMQEIVSTCGQKCGGNQSCRRNIS